MESINIVGRLSEYIGTTESALKLLLALFAGYPLGLIFRKYVYGKEASLQHLFFIISGFSLGYWNYGRDMYHCIFTIFFSYCTLLFLNGTVAAVAVTFVFNLGYLLIGYYFSSTESYDINWTMPQCILTLRLIAIAFDLYDGQQPIENLSTENKKVALQKRPSILEIFGHALFPTAFLVGPQFSMKRYQEFVAGKYSKKGTNQPPDCVEESLRKLCIGVFYLVVFQVLGSIVSDEYLLTEEFANNSFFKKMILMGLWGRLTLYKYISCWLLTEGGCILFGIAYNGEDENGEPKYNGLENIKVELFENSRSFGQYIQAFNVNTNHWLAQYVYKRLKFLGNRHLSQLAALVFLAVWHGLHSGYYVAFFFEFAVMYMERDIKAMVKANENLTTFFAQPYLQLPLNIVQRLYCIIFMGWCLLPFALFDVHSYLLAYANCNYVGVILFVLWPIVYAPILRLIFKKSRVDKTE